MEKPLFLLGTRPHAALRSLSRARWMLGDFLRAVGLQVITCGCNVLVKRKV